MLGSQHPKVRRRKLLQDQGTEMIHGGERTWSKVVDVCYEALHELSHLWRTDSCRCSWPNSLEESKRTGLRSQFQSLCFASCCKPVLLSHCDMRC